MDLVESDTPIRKNGGARFFPTQGFVLP
jgi:hypothetical protein